jgi:hypothetical protein
MSENANYLGDGVYADFDGYQIELKANSHDNPTDVIYLEPSVFESLLRYARRMGFKIPSGEIR